MTASRSRKALAALLMPLTEAGWEFEDEESPLEDFDGEDGTFIFVERSSFHLGVGLGPSGEVTLLPLC